MEDLIALLLNALGDGGQGQVGGLLDDPAKYNPDLYNAAVVIHDSAVKPITAVVLAIMAVVMLADVSTRLEGDRELGVKLIAGTMFKIVLVIVAVENAMVILKAIDQIVTSLANSVNGAPIKAPSGGGVKLGDTLKPKIKEAGLVKQMGLLVVLLIPWLLAEIVSVIGIVLVFVRFLQLYMMTAFASLPVAFLAHPDTKSMGIGYLKRYATVGLQGVMILLAYKLYQALLGTYLSGNAAYDGKQDVFVYITTHFGIFLVCPLVLGFLLIGASSIAKAIVGEG